jgi:hypothetical protein
MAKHSHRNPVSGRFQKMNPERDLAPVNVSGSRSPNTQEIPRYEPHYGVEEQELHGRTPVQIDAQTGEQLGLHASEVPGLPAEIFGGVGVIYHDPTHGGHQQPNPHLSGKTFRDRYREPVLQPGSGQLSTSRVQFGNEAGRHDDGQPLPTRGKNLRPLGQPTTSRP